MFEDFTRSTFALIGIVVTLIVCLVLVVGYAITQDDNNNANDSDAEGARVAAPTSTPFTSTPGLAATSPPITIQPAPVVQQGGGIVATTVPQVAAPVEQAAVATVAPATLANCAIRADWTPYTVVAGDTLSGLAAFYGITLDELALGNCIGNTDILLVDQVIVVPVTAGATLPAVLPQTGAGGGVAATCGTEWFFIFTTGITPTNNCPGGINVVEALAQDFEGGRMIWYAAPPTITNQRGIIYVLYDTGTWESYPDLWNITLPASDPAITAPAGFFQPTEAIGKVWRENQNVRNLMGWSVIAEALPFTGRFQMVVGDQTHFYLDAGASIGALRLNSTAGQNTWEVVGSY